MSIKYNAYHINKILPLFNDVYYEFLLHAIKQANYRIWASIFIVNVMRVEDLELRVRTILKALAVKRKLGLDVRIIIGISDKNPEINLRNEIAINYLTAKGVSVKGYHGSKKSTHSKYVLIDNELSILGSHNWSQYTFVKSNEDSVAIFSYDTNAELSKQFLSSWRR